MQKFFLGALAVVALVVGAPAVHAQEEVAEEPGILTKMGSMLTFYGFLRIDAAYDTEHMNDTEIPSFVLSDDDPASGSSAFTLYTRLTRLGLAFDGGEVGDGFALTGKLETDFYAFDSSDSRNELRIRHAYLHLERDDLAILAGQTWDLFSPLYPSVNADLLNWNAGNTGDRRPQVRVHYTPTVGEETVLGIAGGIALQGAINQREIDGVGDGVIDGEDSGIPQFQVRGSVATPLFTDAPAEVGVWYVLGHEETDGAGIAGEDEWTSTIFGLDLVLPITEDLSLKGEVWSGENLDDLRGGIGQGINATTGDEIAAFGGWAEISYALSDTTRIFAGYSIDDPDDDDLDTNARDLNELIYAGASYRVWEPVRMGWEWIHWKTEYVGLSDGENDRFKIWVAYYF